MNQYDLFGIAIIVLFGLSAGMLFRGWRRAPLDQRARKGGRLLLGAVLCGALCLYRIYSLILSLRIRYAVTFEGIPFAPYWLQPVLLLLPLAVLILAAALFLGKPGTVSLPETGEARKGYQITGMLCVAGGVLLLFLEVIPTMQFLFPG